MSNQQLIRYILKATNKAHLETDIQTEKIKKACQSGCDTCCHQIVDVFTWEEPKVVHFIHSELDNKSKKLIANNLKNWFKAFNNNTRAASRENPLSLQDLQNVNRLFRDKQIPCPFLVNSKCSIYKVRPMICRVHYSDSAEQCQSDPHKSTPHDAQVVFFKASKHFQDETFFVGMKPLPYLVATEFNIEINSKPAMGIRYDPNIVFSNL